MQSFTTQQLIQAINATAESIDTRFDLWNLVSNNSGCESYCFVDQIWKKDDLEIIMYLRVSLNNHGGQLKADSCRPTPSNVGIKLPDNLVMVDTENNVLNLNDLMNTYTFREALIESALGQVKLETINALLDKIIPDNVPKSSGKVYESLKPLLP